MQILERYSRIVLDALPVAVLLVDKDFRVYDLNEAAANLSDSRPEMMLPSIGGAVLHCLHAANPDNDCGDDQSCSDCVFRNSIRSCLAEQAVQRRRMFFQSVQNGEAREFDLLVTVAPLPLRERTLALMVLENITEHTALRALIPICMHCKKIRDDEKCWQRLEAYFHHRAGVNFSHSVCPECMQLHYPDIHLQDHTR